MDARSKRREATRRQLEQQLKERQAREARRKRATLITSVIGTVVVIAVVVTLVITLGGSTDKGKQAGANASSAPTSPTPTPTSAAPTSAAPAVGTPTACTTLTGKSAASFDGVTVANATNLKADPKATSKATTKAKALTCADLVVGTGAAATPKSTVSVQYTGVLYSNGKQFDSSWARKQAASFALTRVIPGFTQGIGGTGKVKPMRVGGRRIIIMPAALGYGSQSPSAAIPANADLVFVVDLLKVS